LKDFGFSREADEEVARELDASLGGTRASDEELLSLFEREAGTVAINGPNMAREIDGAPGVLVTADEATTVAMARGRIPAAVVTDLDGTVSDQVKANDAGAIILVHGHGDNGPAVRKWAPLFAGKTVATTQSRPTGGLRNFGGFTDGDRAVFLANDLRQGLDERIERLFRLRLRRFDHERFLDEVREVHGRRVVSEIHEALREIDGPDALRRQGGRARDELVFPEATEGHVEHAL